MFIYSLKIISLIAQPVLAIGVLVSLWQILIIKKDNQIKLKREAGILALSQGKVFASEILPKMESCYNNLKKIVTLKKFKLPNFFFSEILNDNGEIKNNFSIIKNYYDQNPKMWEELVTLANELESLSMYFTKNIADEELVFSSLSRTFCDFVEYNYFLYCSFRNDNKFNYYESTIELYKVWSVRIKKYDLEKTQENLKKEIKDIEHKDKKIKPLGVD